MLRISSCRRLQLLAEGTPNEPGFGDLIIVDVGGATTDIHSIARGNPTKGNVVMMGLPEPYVKRTVEGDLGVRLNISTLVEYLEEKGILPDKTLEEAIKEISKPGIIPQTESQYTADMLLASVAVEVAMDRHVGKVEIVFTPSGEMAVQRGKDLTEVKHVIGTGGPLVFSHGPRKIMEKALFDEKHADILKPKHPQFYIDKEYILYAAGLLSQTEPELALAVMKRYIVPV